MKPPRFGVRLAAAGAILLALFSALATWAIDAGHWPELPPGALRDVDLWAGLAFLLLFVGALLFRREGRKQ
jgi:hypothetical protein